MLKLRALKGLVKLISHFWRIDIYEDNHNRNAIDISHQLSQFFDLLSLVVIFFFTRMQALFTELYEW